MQKISGILPQTPRLSRVETSGAHAARPGAPILGRSQGVVTAHDRVSISSAARDKFKTQLQSTTQRQAWAEAQDWSRLDQNATQVDQNWTPLDQASNQTSQDSESLEVPDTFIKEGTLDLNE